LRVVFYLLAEGAFAEEASERLFSRVRPEMGNEVPFDKESFPTVLTGEIWLVDLLVLFVIVIRGTLVVTHRASKNSRLRDDLQMRCLSPRVRNLCAYFRQNRHLASAQKRKNSEKKKKQKNGERTDFPTPD